MASRRPRRAGPDALTRRESDVLDAIGRRLTNGELAEELHVSVRTVESHVAALRRKLGATSRAELIEAAATRAQRAAVAGPDTDLVGRDEMVAALETRLGADRLVTLVGPAGVGKSRLAREVARRSAIEVRLVDLVGVEPEAVAVAAADAIGVGSAEGADIEGGLRLAVADRRLLLVVDNADRVVDAVARLAGILIEAAPGLQVLVTGRRRLGLAIETVQGVPPLDLPDDDRVETVLASPAVRLLMERARSVRPGLAVDEANAAAVARLCRRLDGLPLALELAAARLGSVDVAELEVMLAPHIDLLGRPGTADRHRSLVAAVDGSLATLTPVELSVLTAAAALSGPATLDELQAVIVAGDDDHVGADVARSVLDLVDQSLLEPQLGAGPSTFRVLETIRSVVLDRAEPGVVDRCRAANARYHTTRIEAAVDRSRAGDGWDYATDRSRRTLLGALRWAAANEPELGARLLAAIAKRYELDPTLAVLDEVRRVLVERALPDGWPSDSLAWAGVVLNYLDLDLMDRAATAAVERATTADEEALGHWAVGFSAGYRGRESEAIEALARAEAAFRDRGDLVMVGLCLMAEGLVRRDHEAALVAFESSLVTFRRAGVRWHANSVLLAAARRAIEAGVRLDEVAVWIDESAGFADDHTELRHDQAHALAARAELAVATGADDGGALADRAAEAFRHHGDLRCLVRALLLRARAETDPGLALDLARHAVGAAVVQGDERAQRSAVSAVVELAGAADEPVVEARARGVERRLAGDGQPPPDAGGRFRVAMLEGFAEGPTSVALGPDAKPPGPATIDL